MAVPMPLYQLTRSGGENGPPVCPTYTINLPLRFWNGDKFVSSTFRSAVSEIGNCALVPKMLCAKVSKLILMRRLASPSLAVGAGNIGGVANRSGIAPPPQTGEVERAVCGRAHSTNEAAAIGA